MEARYLFFPLVIGLTIGLCIVLNESSRQDIIAHWSDRRCDFDVLLTSFMYKPPEDKQSISEFAAGNFKFCVTSKTSAYLESIFGVLYEVLRKQFAASDIMTQVMKVLRSQLNTIYQPFSLMMTKFWTKFKQIGGLASRIFQHLYMAMKKAAATAIASIFVALSVQTAILNTIDLVIKIIMIVLYILLALLFIFFLPILPFLVIVILTVSGIETAMPGSTGDMGAIFCFAEETSVVMNDMKEQFINGLKPGDVLYGNNIVQAVIEVPGETLYNLDGVLVSGYHCVYDSNNEIIYVKDHPNAKKTSEWRDTLWTLITSKREIHVKGLTSLLRFLDWDEIPDTKKAEAAWDKVAGEILNGEGFVSKAVPIAAPSLEPTVKVWVHQGGWRPLSDIKIGTWIYDREGWTRVIGKSVRKVAHGFSSQITDGNWILDSTGKWQHPIRQSVSNKPWTGIQLITESGSFTIQLNTRNVLIVRDFTEVGAKKILESHTRVEKLLEHLK